ncbi:hypothetical protein [Streptomyces mirabilis]|uniref:hypothetical protein n=1 Tax=Streptomyces mirabilis TaxID=68239 RepID=UPI0038166CD7
MRKTALLAAPLALAASLALAAPASASPEATPAVRCSPVVSFIGHPLPEPYWTNLNNVAKGLGLPGVPGAVGLRCDHPERTTIDGPIHPYSGSGPVILRGVGISPLQVYCAHSSEATLSIEGNPLPLPGIIGTDCATEADPIAV